nr:hypothetical protein K4M20_00096 [Agrobacterium fabrum]
MAELKTAKTSVVEFTAPRSIQSFGEVSGFQR